MDRLDYLKRDTFFTGVSEGATGTERIIKMLNVSNDQLVVEDKGIYSLENFLIARRIMYWQVYLHKTVLSAENMLVKTLKRAGFLTKNGTDVFATPALKYFLENEFSVNDINSNPGILGQYTQLDDFDIFTSIKTWRYHNDNILATLSSNLINRKLFRCEIQSEPFDYFYIEEIKDKIQKKYNINNEDLVYLFFSDTTSNYSYNIESDNIGILTKSGKTSDLIEASAHQDISIHSYVVTKHFICYPKDVDNS
jgi:HD superfamily phosphohydrolase